ncbi:MAG: hypothetical protein IPL20_15530 [Saprospiraceae bacterium]|nr:hypothetical protein [Saprospiraceae bacterium]
MLNAYATSFISSYWTIPVIFFFTTHNYKADNINNTALQRLHTPDVAFLRQKSPGNFRTNFSPWKKCHTPERPEVMFTKNDISGGGGAILMEKSEKLLLGEDEIVVSCGGVMIHHSVDKYEWLHKKI